MKKLVFVSLILIILVLMIVPAYCQELYVDEFKLHGLPPYPFDDEETHYVVAMPKGEGDVLLYVSNTPYSMAGQFQRSLYTFEGFNCYVIENGTWVLNPNEDNGSSMSLIQVFNENLYTHFSNSPISNVYANAIKSAPYSLRIKPTFPEGYGTNYLIARSHIVYATQFYSRIDMYTTDGYFYTDSEGKFYSTGEVKRFPYKITQPGGQGTRLVHVWGSDGWKSEWQPDTYIDYGSLVHDDCEIIECGEPIYTDSTLYTVYLSYSGAMKATTRITLPRDGFVDNSSIFNFWVYSYVEDISKFNPDSLTYKITIDGELPSSLGLYTLITNNKVVKRGDKQDMDLTFDLEIPDGEHTVRVELLYDGETVSFDDVTVERLVGFVDADGDGIDDRTGRADANYDPPLNPSRPDSPTLPEDGNVLDWLVYLGDYIAYIFNLLINSIGSLASNVVSGAGTILNMVQPVFRFIEQFFSSMPKPISDGVLGIISIGFAVGLLKLIRG